MFLEAEQSFLSPFADCSGVLFWESYFVIGPSGTSFLFIFEKKENMKMCFESWRSEGSSSSFTKASLQVFCCFSSFFGLFCFGFCVFSCFGFPILR